MFATGGQHRRHAIPLRDEKHMMPATVDRNIDDSIRCGRHPRRQHGAPSPVHAEEIGSRALKVHHVAQEDAR
jgi:hypothetical protein